MQDQESMRHVGISTHRLKDNPREKVFADAWEEVNDTSAPGRRESQLSWLLHLNEQGNGVSTQATSQERSIAATLIQWLGSPVGFHFLEETLGKCGYDITPKPVQPKKPKMWSGILRGK